MGSKIKCRTLVKRDRKAVNNSSERKMENYTRQFQDEASNPLMSGEENEQREPFFFLHSPYADTLIPSTQHILTGCGTGSCILSDRFLTPIRHLAATSTLISSPLLIYPHPMVQPGQRHP